MERMSDIFDLYKPLRNYLRKADLSTCLGPLRWYINYTQFAIPPDKPDDLEVHREFWSNPLAYTPPWQLAIIVRELILEANLDSGTLDFRRWKDFAGAVNKVKELENNLSKRFIGQGDVYHYISKILPHQQFVWQENRPNHRASTRYYTIFNGEPLRSMFEEHFGINIEKYFLISTTMLGTYMTNLGLNYPPTIQFKENPFDNTDYDNFISHYALPLDELQRRLKDPAERRMDETFPIYFDSLKRNPIIFTDLGGLPSHVCPIPTYLYWRTTDGIYYDLIEAFRADTVKFEAFGSALGEAYSQYVGKVLGDQPYNRTVAIVDADSVIEFGKPKPDWFIVDNDSVALVECKTKRLTLGAKTDMTFSPATETELKKLAKAVVQVYKALRYAKDNQLSYLGSPSCYFPIVVTMENWYIFGDMQRHLDVLVQETATVDGVPEQLLRDNPYTLIASDEIENLSIALRTNPLDTILTPYLTDDKYNGWSLKTYLLQQFKPAPADKDLFEVNPLSKAFEKLTGIPDI